MSQEEEDNAETIALMDKVSTVLEDNDLGTVLEALLSLTISTMIMKLDLSVTPQEWEHDSRVFLEANSEVALKIAALDYNTDRKPDMARYQVQEGA